jgi:hypothetical protein
VFENEAETEEDEMNSTHEIDGYGIVLPQVQNYYPVEKCIKTDRYYWGFKYLSGIFEFFYYVNESEAQHDRGQFIEAINNHYYWKAK